MRVITLSIFLFLSVILYGQIENCKESNIKKSLSYLAGENMRGREAGTKEELKAALYISSRLKSYGYKPFFDNSPFQLFDLRKKRTSGEGSGLYFEGQSFMLGVDFFVPPVSVSGNVKGVIIIYSSKINDTNAYKGKIVVFNSSSDSILLRVASMRDKGATAILYYSGSTLDTLREICSPPTPIPVMQITEECERILSGQNGKEVNVVTDVSAENSTSQNVVMSLSIAQGLPFIMIGAHYDHIGIGPGDGRRKGKSEVNNGADDNASGVSSVMEIARMLVADKKYLKYNIIIAAFGAEEKGLIGSRKLADTLKKMKMLPEIMFNLDMVGRLKDNKLLIGGGGTFNEADSIINEVNKNFRFDISVTKDGYGSSDNSPFCSDGIPVLYFTSGVNAEYHTPDDDVKLINFPGMALVTNYVYSVVRKIGISGMIPEYISILPPLAAKRTNLEATIGLTPDFEYVAGDGCKIGSVAEGRTAHSAGMLAGDIITAINSRKVANIYDYMAILAELKPREKVVVDVRRTGKELKLIIHL